LSFPRIFVVSCLVLLFSVSLFGAASAYVQSSVHSSSQNVTKPVFVWLFGYTGDYFFPQTQLKISIQQVVSAARAVSQAVGSSNVRLVAVVGEEPGKNVQSSYISTIKGFVSQLKPYASVLYGRLDMQEFNSNTNPSLLSQVSLFVNQLGLNGVWFDHGPNLWQSMGSTKFNAMMQSIIKAFPNLNIIMNQAVNKGGWITPAKGTTWGLHTYISPSVRSGSCCVVDDSIIKTLNGIYPGRVLVHFDAFATVPSEPMGIFALKSTSFQESTVKTLVYKGVHSSSQYAYDFQFPIIGAWTYDGSKFHGTLYNSLSSGVYYQGTESSFIATMKTV
jgi:hypothetical protein